MWGEAWGSMIWGGAAFAADAQVPIGPWALLILGFVLGISAVFARRHLVARVLPLAVIAVVPVLSIATVSLITFNNGEIADADAVNANFESLAVESATQDGRISALETGKQERVTGFCNSGFLMRAVNANGTVVCDEDDDSGGDITSVKAGPGLLGGSESGTAFVEVDPSYVQRRVTATCTGGAIRRITQEGQVECVNISSGGGTGIDGIVTSSTSGLDGGCTSGTCTMNVDSTELNGTTPIDEWWQQGSQFVVSTSGTNWVALGAVGVTTPKDGIVGLTGSTMVQCENCEAPNHGAICYVGWSTSPSQAPATFAVARPQNTPIVSYANPTAVAAIPVTGNGSTTQVTFFYLRGRSFNSNVCRFFGVNALAVYQPTE